MKTLPKGVFITVRNIPITVDEAFVAAKFADGGIDLDEDQISIGSSGHHSYAYCIVSLNKSQVVSLVERAMRGRGLEFLVP